MNSLLILALSVAPAFGQQLVLNLDPAQTTVKFTLGASLHTVHGDFKLRRGEIRFDPLTGKVGGRIVVDAASGESGSDGRDKRMHQKVLESDGYPDIEFTPDRVEGKVSLTGASDVQVHGLFKIHGAEHEITLPIKVQLAPDHVTASTSFEIPYIKWGMKNPSTLVFRVRDKVTVDFQAVGHVTASPD